MTEEQEVSLSVAIVLLKQNGMVQFSQELRGLRDHVRKIEGTPAAERESVARGMLDAQRARELRNYALEEAAVVAEQWDHTGVKIAAQIRELKKL